MQTKINLSDLSSYLVQHSWDNLEDSSLIATHCINHSLGNGDTSQCSHDHVSCSACSKIFLGLDAGAEVKREINDLPASDLPSIEKYVLTK